MLAFTTLLYVLIKNFGEVENFYQFNCLNAVVINEHIYFKPSEQGAS